jgi:hypothetical protein
MTLSVPPNSDEAAFVAFRDDRRTGRSARGKGEVKTPMLATFTATPTLTEARAFWSIDRLDARYEPTGYAASVA